MHTNTNELLSFVVTAHKAGFSTGDTRLHTKEKDSSITIQFDQDKWRMHDNYFGGEPYGGREVVFYDNKPVWIMVYYGYVHEIVQKPEIEQVYSFLRKALSLVTIDNPFRGPHVFGEGDLTYKNLSEGNISQFSGGELILQSNKELYRATYTGGLINQRD